MVFSMELIYVFFLNLEYNKTGSIVLIVKAKDKGRTKISVELLQILVKVIVLEMASPSEGKGKP